jgi:hypothetical protein
VIGQEANDTANTVFRSGNEKAVTILLPGCDARLKRREVIVEYERAFVLRILHTACALVTRAKVTVRVVCNRSRWNCFFYLTLPRPLRSMW